MQVHTDAYKWPMVAFGTALLLNALTVAMERETAKFQLALVACYINLLAGINDYMSWRGYTPVLRDPFGNGFQLVRLVGASQVSIQLILS